MTVPTLTLNSGRTMPQLGLGMWQASNEETEAAVTAALGSGYRLIDTAQVYANEEGVGRALAATTVPREELFITTKLWNADQGYDEALAAFDASMERLGLETLDLYLIHWPLGDAERRLATWRALVALQEQGRVASIGVSNFYPSQIQELVDATGVVPALNQIELHPHFPQWVARAFHNDLGIVTQSWSPLGGSTGGLWEKRGKPNSLLTDPVIAEIAEAHGKSPAQVLIRWHLQNGLAVIPKSVDPERIAQNIDVMDFRLTGGDLERIAAISTGERFGLDPYENV